MKSGLRQVFLTGDPENIADQSVPGESFTSSSSLCAASPPNPSSLTDPLCPFYLAPGSLVSHSALYRSSLLTSPGISLMDNLSLVYQGSSWPLKGAGVGAAGKDGQDQ